MRLLIILAFLAVAACDSKKSLSKSSDQSKITESNESSSSTRTQLTQDWSWVGSSLESRDGSTRIEFDGPSTVEIRPDQSISATGSNARVTSTATSTRQDTTVAMGSTAELIEKDTTSSSAKEQQLDIKTKVLDKEVETQKIAPILILIALIILAIYIFIQSPPTFK